MGRRAAGLRASLVVTLLLVGACSSSTETSSDTASAESDGTSDQPAATSAPGGTTPGGSIPERFVGHESEMYGQPENWLCVPGAPNDLCATEDLDTTIVRGDGSTEVVEVRPAVDAPFDCFYVYPTVNLIGTEPADEAMAADIGAEMAVIRAQAARFSEVCDVYAPLYRQLTLGGFGAENRAELSDRAFGDVRDAFAHYMATWNDGRPVLLVGHSQGAGMLARLLTEEFDPDPELRAQLVSAMLLGGRAEIAAAGGDVVAGYEHLGPCRSDDEIGCIIGFNTVGADAPPEDRARWGSASAGNQRLCTNPADLAGGGPAPLRSIFANVGAFTVDPSSPITTPWVELDGYLEATCDADDDTSVLLVTVAAGPDDVRDLGDRLDNVAGWGLHITEVGLTQGDLIDIARAQGAAIGG